MGVSFIFGANQTVDHRCKLAPSSSSSSSSSSSCSSVSLKLSAGLCTRMDLAFGCQVITDNHLNWPVLGYIGTHDVPTKPTLESGGGGCWRKRRRRRNGRDSAGMIGLGRHSSAEEDERKREWREWALVLEKSSSSITLQFGMFIVITLNRWFMSGKNMFTWNVCHHLVPEQVSQSIPSIESRLFETFPCLIGITFIGLILILKMMRCMLHDK